MNAGEYIDHLAGRLEAAGLYFGHGTDNATDEAGWLLQAAWERLDEDAEPAADSRVPAAVIDLSERFLRERVDSRKPLAYILGEAWFCGLRFQIGPGVLVPRSPIAELIAEGFAPWLELNGESRVLDICTGSGCIGLAIAHCLPVMRVDLADISAAALEVAENNRRCLGLAARTRVIQSDGFDALAGRRYSLIVANPPYVSNSEYRELPAEYLREPRLGLTSGEDGLDLVVRLLARADEHLEENGVFICEVGASWETLAELSPRLPFVWLEFEHGGEGVFLLQRRALRAAKQGIIAELERRRRESG